MRSHPDDAAFLDRLSFTTGHPCGYDYGCDRHPDAPTVRYDGDWICRNDLAWRLHLDRCDALDASREATPSLAPAQ